MGDLILPYREITLSSRKYPDRVALVDASNYEWLAEWKWYPDKRVLKSGTVRWYARRFKDGKQVYMHREIAGVDNGVEIDHWDGDGLHNWLANLRICTHQENMQNQKRGLPSKTSRFKGVSWDSTRQRWHASIGITTVTGTRTIFLGRFLIEEDAARAYDVAALFYFGPFASVNSQG